MTEELKHLSYEERLIRARPVQPRREKAWGNLSVYKYLKEGCKEDRARLFSGAQCQDKRQWAQTGAQEVPPKHQEALLLCHLHSTVAQVDQGGGGVSSLEIFKSHLGLSKATLLWVPLLEQGVEPDDLQRYLQLLSLIHISEPTRPY